MRRLLALALLLAGGAAAARAAELPLPWSWLEQRVPPGAPRAVLGDFLTGLPAQLCALGPANFSALPLAFMDELCPAKRLREAAALRRPPAARLPLAAAFPATLGGAALLLASDTTAAAAALQGRFCDIFKDPAAACDWRTPLDTGYAAHLTGRGANSSSALRGGLAAAFSGLAAALPQLPASAPGFLSLSDPLEGLSEGVVQGAMYWFGGALPAARARALEAFMPPALYPYFSAALARLPEALCASTTPVSAIADLPVAFKDEVCPLANIFKPALGGVGLSTYTFVAVQLASGVNVSDLSPWSRGKQAAAAGSGGGAAATPAVPLPPPSGVKAPLPAGAPRASGAPKEAAADAAEAARMADAQAQYEAHAAAAAAKEAATRRALAWLGRMCHVLYSPEVACKPAAAAALNGTRDVWGAYAALAPLASPADWDALQARVDARRFASVAVLAAALRRLPAAQRGELARNLRRGVDSLPAAIRAAPPAAALALYGPLQPWLCVPTFEGMRARVNGDLPEALGLVGDLLVRAALRLDEPVALLASVLGDSAARPALADACGALREARATVAVAAAPARAALRRRVRGDDPAVQAAYQPA